MHIFSTQDYYLFLREGKRVEPKKNRIVPKDLIVGAQRLNSIVFQMLGDNSVI